MVPTSPRGTSPSIWWKKRENTDKRWGCHDFSGEHRRAQESTGRREEKKKTKKEKKTHDDLR